MSSGAGGWLALGALVGGLYIAYKYGEQQGRQAERPIALAEGRWQGWRGGTQWTQSVYEPRLQEERRAREAAEAQAQQFRVENARLSRQPLSLPQGWARLPDGTDWRYN